MLEVVEDELGTRLPPAFRCLYEVTNGASILVGNLMLHGIGKSDLVAFPEASQALRE